MHVMGGSEILSGKEMFAIHEGVMRTIAQTPVRAPFPDGAFDRLEAAGLRVDRAANLIAFPDEEPILETIRQLCGAETAGVDEKGSSAPDTVHVVPKAVKPYVGSNAGYLYDADSAVLRKATVKDLPDSIKVVSHVMGTRAHPCLLPQDVPSQVMYLFSDAVTLKYVPRSPGAKTIGGECVSPQDGDWKPRLAEAAGYPGVKWPGSAVLPKSPFEIEGRALDVLLDAVQRGRPPAFANMVLPGASSPVTMPAFLVVTLAELFAMHTIGRLLCDPPHNTLGERCLDTDCALLDLRRGVQVLSAPETLHMRVGLRQMLSRFYKTPGRMLARFFTDAKEPGIQQAYENALVTGCDLGAGYWMKESQLGDGTALAGVCGALATNLAVCYEQMLLDADMVRWLSKWFRGFDVNEETLALDEIREAGPGGLHTGTEHTVRHMRTACFYPKYFHRGYWDDYVGSGRKDPLALAREEVSDVLKQDLEPAISDSACRDLEKTLEEAMHALCGKRQEVRLP